MAEEEKWQERKGNRRHIVNSLISIPKISLQTSKPKPHGLNGPKIYCPSPSPWKLHAKLDAQALSLTRPYSGLGPGSASDV